MTQESPAPRRVIKRVVVQAHVQYDDDSRALFTTPGLCCNEGFDPRILIPLIGDAGRWLVAKAADGFVPLEGCNVVGMPFNVMVTDSFRHNPGDSIIACADYRGVELDMTIPTTVEMAVPPSAWGQWGI